MTSPIFRKPRTCVASVAFLLLAQTAAAAGRCPAGMTMVGATCIDRYEAQAWEVPDPTGANKALVKKIQKGKATTADLEAAGARLLGVPVGDFNPCLFTGAGCSNVFAVSLPGVTPSRWPSWFQAQEACTNSGKRLPSNAEWQAAAMGTPNDAIDDEATTCNIDGSTIVPTGSRSACVSSRGLHDMSGNLREWVADWVPHGDACPGWGGATDDQMCLSGASLAAFGPAALLRGGGFFDGAGAGPHAVDAMATPTTTFHANGFRCAR